MIPPDQPPPRASRPELRPDGIVADRCRLIHRLGQGGMGEVWLAEHTTLKTRVAVKFLTDELAEQETSMRAHERFMFEAQVSAMLANETAHVVRVHDAGRDSSGPYMIMEYVDGRSLERALEEDGPLAPPALAEILDQLATALAIAHKRSIVHRDLKPGNVLLSAGQNGKIHAKLADFGIAKATSPGAPLVRPQETVDGLLIGSPDYMSPEQLQTSRDVDARADIWALGVLAYEALTGNLPFDAPTMGGVVIAVTTAGFAPPSSVRPDLPPQLDAWFARVLAKRKEDRFSTITEMARAFRGALDAAHPSGPPVEVATAPPKSRVATVGAVVLAVAAAVALLGWLATRESVPRGSATASAPLEASAAPAPPPPAPRVADTPAEPVRAPDAPTASAPLRTPAPSATPAPRTTGPAPRPRPAPSPTAGARDPSATF